MYWYIENPKESTKKPNRANKWIQKSCKYKITQNTIVFLYTTGIESKKEIKKTVPFILASKSMQELKDLYSESYTTLLKDIKEDLNKWKDILCLWIWRLNIKMAILCKTVYIFNMMSIKIPVTFFAELEKLIFNFLWNFSGPK